MLDMVVMETVVKVMVVKETGKCFCLEHMASAGICIP